ncbi:MAG: RICIN domain-containing protein [Pseudomonadota bacterium]
MKMQHTPPATRTLRRGRAYALAASIAAIWVAPQAAQALPDGRYTIVNAASGKCVDVAGASMAEGGNIQQANCSGHQAQLFELSQPQPGVYKLRSVLSGKVVDVSGASTADGANVQQWTDNGTNAQRFRIAPSGNGHVITNVNSGKCIDVAGGSLLDGANIQQWSCNGSGAQRFVFQPRDGNGGWRLVWRDEFDGNAVDPGKWEFEVNGKGGGNNELQYYTARPQNAYVANGLLTIQALRERYCGADGCRDYTSARLRTLGKGDWRYGRIEARARLPRGQGLWPAIWMLPTDWVYGGWAASGEIDIMEAVNPAAAGGNRIYGTLHYGGAWPNNTHKGGSTVPAGSVVDQFHVYAVEWEPTQIRFYVDGQLYHTATEWWSSGGAFPAPFNQRFHLILNVAVGGNWPGSPDGNTVFPQRMEVDYVRVYQR